MFNQQIARIVQHHLVDYLKMPRDITQIFVEQQKNNQAFMAAWQILVEEHQKANISHHDGSDIVQIDVENIKQSFVAFHPPMARLGVFFQQIRQKIDEIYPLYLMLNEWQKSLKLNDYPQHYLPLLAFFLKSKHHSLENIWLLEDLLLVDPSIEADIYTQNKQRFEVLWQKISLEPKVFFKENQDKIRLIEFLNLTPQGHRDCSHYLLEWLELYIMHTSQYFFNHSAAACYTKQPLAENIIAFLDQSSIK